jgi:sugar phosphate isomerase/epimerase
MDRDSPIHRTPSIPLQGDLVFLQGAFLPYSEWKMNRREFVGLTASAVLAQALPASALPSAPYKPLALGLVINPFGAPEEHFRQVKAMGFPTVFLSLDKYIGGFTPALATQFRDLLAKYQLTATAVEVVGPGELKWDFLQGPSTVGVVPPKTRAARIDALRQVSDFAKLVGISQVQTHCGFIPENPSDPLYPQVVEAIRTVASHCQGNGQDFLMETGQETPTAMSRCIRDVNLPNLGVGLDTANLILYGKANPVDAVDILGPHIRNMHAKDGLWPTDPDQLGKEVQIGKGLVDFHQVFTKLRRAGYTGPVTIEREISGPQQIEDVRQEKIYLERVLNQI